MWTVTLDYHPYPHLNDEQMDELVEQLGRRLHGAMGGDTILDLAGYTVSVEADSPHGAARAADSAIREIMAQIGADAGHLIRAEVNDEDWDDRLAKRDELVSVTDIAQMLDVSRQRAHQLTQRIDFPAPAASPASGAVWRRLAVEAWIQRRGEPKAGRPRKADPVDLISYLNGRRVAMEIKSATTASYGVVLSRDDSASELLGLSLPEQEEKARRS